ncbi:hypothetical protein B0J18DRAFT_428405 [Chaetomium sp. MPI-SDFR-AT-0129]|uniref:Uncharacterized protein n=1 Tax=Dichotomopilus funicola TaxID=1934379 RepID=A0AAN6ZQC4_9PEZI|nr:hypothetical protein B0J18DRAFT_428405 [Chaetomium sp. MPI-SDFR-AT-0129]KAK4146393.1 hypothetical protein C8A04DRAFT_25903 [Dichotomopilus funicola]
MHLSNLLPLSLLGLAAAASLPKTSPFHRDQTVPLSLLAKRACGETAPQVCYGVSGGTSQDLDPDDISYAAAFLRYQADNNGNPIWQMPSEFDCSEWTLPLAGAGTVLALAKHINPRTNSGVTYTDLARTIDGGADATDEQLAASLLGSCGKNGGQMGVTVDAADPAYHTSDYLASGMKPADIIVKLVRNPDPSS